MYSYTGPDIKTAEETVQYLNQCQMWRNEPSVTEVESIHTSHWSADSQVVNELDFCSTNGVCGCLGVCQKILPELSLIEQLNFDYYVPEMDKTRDSNLSQESTDTTAAEESLTRDQSWRPSYWMGSVIRTSGGKQ